MQDYKTGYCQKVKMAIKTYGHYLLQYFEAVRSVSPFNQPEKAI
jgi:hypothetical protein